MDMNEQKIKEILIGQDENFKNLTMKHQEFDLRLKELSDLSIKTDMDLIEERNLKKEKLKLKDSMQKVIFEYKRNVEERD
jgi:uncharacterized protein YdcH (DUF465 family)